MNSEITSNLPVQRTENLNEKFELQYNLEYPFYEQTDSWKSKMTYRYSPEDYLLTRGQYIRMQTSGQLVGEYLERMFPNANLLEFRLDFVCDKTGRLFITEAQTDDRGLPATAVARNARGRKRLRIFSGVSKSFAAALVQKSGKPNPFLVIIYPQEEEFYYTGFRDFAQLCWAENPESNILVSSNSDVSAFGRGCQTMQINFPEGIKFLGRPDFFWDFSDTLFKQSFSIQPLVNKQFLLDIWQKDNPLSIKLRDYIPQVKPANDPEVVQEKDNWILKPVSGRWSKGVVIGQKMPTTEWEELTIGSKDLIAQKFIEPKQEYFYVREKKKAEFKKEPFFARVEGYYCVDSSEWKLADVLATCTPDIPVHGKRDCIMIPGKVKYL